MPIYYDIEKDYLYKKGIEKGIEKTKREDAIIFIKSLLTNTEFTHEKIAQLIGVDIDFVKEIAGDFQALTKL